MKRHKKKVALKWWVKTYRLAFKRKLSLLLTGAYDPYPKPPKGVSLSPSLAHFSEYGKAPLKLAWAKGTVSDPRKWQEAARRKLTELLGYEPDRDIPTVKHEKEFPMPGGLVKKQIYLKVRDHWDIPVTLLWKKQGLHPRPVLIYMAGSTSGVHVGWGETRIPADYLLLGVGADMARQAAERGYLVVCIEQACFGLREERHLKPRSVARCVDAANHALLLGRSLLGELVTDVSSVNDWVVAESGALGCDLDKLYVFGHSAGGTVALHAAAVDLRIRGAVCSGCIGFIRETTGLRRDPEGASVVPGVLRWMETDDIVSLCAPRPFIAVSGIYDHIYPSGGVERVIQGARRFYRLFNADELLTAAAGKAGHQYYPEVTWAAVSDVFGK